MNHKPISLFKTPLTHEEWKEVQRYQRVPLAKKLALLDKLRSFLFEVWSLNPSIHKQLKRFRRGTL
ncbi:MAG: hypothetical protein Q7S00_06385 [bacterium]|nr:hypothetical protein [bacterium]